MNRTVVIGGVVAVAVLLGVAAWLLLGSKTPKSTTEQLAANQSGPIALNPVEAVTDPEASEALDGRTLNIKFPAFEVSGKSGDTATKVFSTTWRVKLAPEERALVAVATIDGSMKSTAGFSTPAPTPAAPEPTTAAAPDAATPPTDRTDVAVTAAEPPKPAPAPAASKPVAGDGVARVIVTFGSDTSVTEWTDTTGSGGSHKVTKATALTSGPAELRNGGTIPVTVTLELHGGTSTDTSAKINAIDLRLFAETVPVAPTEPGTETPATSSTPATETPATTPETAPATPAAPDAGSTTPPPADSTTPPTTPAPTTPSP